MSKLLILFLLGGAIVLVMTGVVQVNLNTDKIPQAPSVVTELVGNQTVVERPRTYVVRLKRVAEMFFVDNESERMEVTLEHVEADAERLLELVEKAESAGALVPQTELLIGSLEKAKKESRDVSPEVLVSMRDRSEVVFQTAYSAFVSVDQKVAALAGDTDRLANTVESLQQEVGGLVEVVPSVAGAEDQGEDEEPESDSLLESSEAIPLKF